MIQIRHEWREGKQEAGAGAERGKKERGKRKVNNNVRIVDINKRQRQIMFLQSKFNRSPIVIIVGKRWMLRNRLVYLRSDRSLINPTISENLLG